MGESPYYSTAQISKEHILFTCIGNKFYLNNLYGSISTSITSRLEKNDERNVNFFVSKTYGRLRIWSLKDEEQELSED